MDGFESPAPSSSTGAAVAQRQRRPAQTRSRCGFDSRPRYARRRSSSGRALSRYDRGGQFESGRRLSRGCSSAGRAPPRHGGGRPFDPGQPLQHQAKPTSPTEGGGVDVHQRVPVRRDGGPPAREVRSALTWPRLSRSNREAAPSEAATRARKPRCSYASGTAPMTDAPAPTTTSAAWPSSSVN